ncbi:MAG: hypothetical protein JWN43_2604 [Gammaproteobacteria bacterium]|nr:hypothetical protein [Gammaproteobacteria bacterium]
MTLILGGCASGDIPLMQGPQVSEPVCTASCNAHYEQCPQVFAAFPERGAVECPAEHTQCLKSCATRPHAVASSVSAAPAGSAPAVAPREASVSREARLRELKHLHDEGLVTDDVYKERQRAILSEP